MRGQFYSMIAIVIAIPILFFISGTILSIQETKYNVIDKISADQLSAIANNVEDDFHRGVEISFKRSILAATDFVITNGTFLDDGITSILELSINGTLFGTPKYFLINNTISDWRNRILNSSSTFFVDLSYTDPSGIQVENSFVGDYAINLIVKDRFEKGMINRTAVTKQYEFSVEEFEDPMYPLYSYGLIRRHYKLYPYHISAIKFAGTIANTNITGNATFNDTLPAGPRSTLILVTNKTSVSNGWLCVIGPPNFDEQSHACYVKLQDSDPFNSINNIITPMNYTELYIDNKTGSAWTLPIKEALRHGLYTQGILPGPGIVERLEGRLSLFIYDVKFVSFVNTDEYRAYGLPVDDKISTIDWIYWAANSSNGKIYRGFDDIPWFRLDNGGAAFLNLTQLRAN